MTRPMTSQPATRLVTGRAGPQPQQGTDRGLAGGHGDDGHQEVLGEQLAVGQGQGDEPDREGEGGQQLVAGGLLDDEQGEDAQADVGAAHQARGKKPGPGPVEPRLTLVDGPLEGRREIADDRVLSEGDYGREGCTQIPRSCIRSTWCRITSLGTRRGAGWPVEVEVLRVDRLS